MDDVKTRLFIVYVFFSMFLSINMFIFRDTITGIVYSEMGVSDPSNMNVVQSASIFFKIIPLGLTHEVGVIVLTILTAWIFIGMFIMASFIFNR